MRGKIYFTNYTLCNGTVRLVGALQVTIARSDLAICLAAVLLLLDYKSLESLTSAALFTIDTYIPTYQIVTLGNWNGLG